MARAQRAAGDIPCEPRSPSSAPAPRACCSAICWQSRHRQHHRRTASSADYVLGRIRAGVLEQVTVDLLDEVGVGARMHAEGLLHDGFELCFEGQRHRIDMHGLTRQARDGLWPDRGHARPDGRAQGRGAHGLRGAATSACTISTASAPSVRYVKDGQSHEIDCDFIAGCDGFHGVCRASVPPGMHHGPTRRSTRSAGSASWPTCRPCRTS